MRVMRYINLFSKVSGVNTLNCLLYNNQIIFAIPKSQISKAIGKEAANVKKLRNILGRKIKVIAMPSEQNNEKITKFVKDIVAPNEFAKLDIKDNSATLTAGRQSKAALIGRNRAREKELSSILKDHFSITNFKIA